MECLLAFLLMMAVMVTLMFIIFVGARPRRLQGLKALAQRYRGTYSRRGVFSDRGIARFRYGMSGVPVTVTTVNARGGSYTELRVEWSEPRLQCYIVPALIARHVRVKRRMPRLALGNEDFDRHYVLWSNDAAATRSLLSDGVRWELDRLRYFLNNQEVRVRIDRGVLSIKKPPRLRRFEELDEFVRLALDFYDQALLTRSTGIAFVEASGAQPVTEAICQICGENVTTDMVFCRRCKTPHHAECWQYTGACSTYGCQETQYVVPRIADPWSDSRIAKPR